MSCKQTDEYLEQMRELEEERESEEYHETVAKEEYWWDQANWRDVNRHLENQLKDLMNDKPIRRSKWI